MAEKIQQLSTLQNHYNLRVKQIFASFVNFPCDLTGVILLEEGGVSYTNSCYVKITIKFWNILWWYSVTGCDVKTVFVLWCYSELR